MSIDGLDVGRVILRRAMAQDAQAIYATYASDPRVTRYLGWSRHVSEQDSLAFVRFADAQWDAHGFGPYLAYDSCDLQLVGCTGLTHVSAQVVSTGVVLAHDARHKGYGRQMIRAMVSMARAMRVSSVLAACHTSNAASIGLLRSCGFAFRRVTTQYRFPNLADPVAQAYEFEVAMGERAG